MIYTSYFARQKKMELPDAAYVSIAMGNPRYAVPYQIINLSMLKPVGIFKVYEGEEYKKHYFERLDRFGVDAIRNAIKAVQGEHQDVILMCHEKNKLECHRSMFAEWWFSKTGEEIRELGEKPVEKENEQLSFLL